MHFLNGLLMLSGAAGTSVNVIIDGEEIMEPLEAEIVNQILDAELFDVTLDAELPDPLEAEIV